MRLRLVFVLYILFVAGFVQSQETTPLLAGSRGDDLVILQADGETVLIEDGESLYQWVPLDSNSRGDLLYMSTDSQAYSLYVYDGESHLIVPDIAGMCTPVFLDDDHVVYVSNQVEREYADESGFNRIILSVLSHNIHSNETERINSFDFPGIGGGGGGSAYLMDMIVDAEIVTNGFLDTRNTFTVADGNLLITGKGRCGHGIQTILDGQATEIVSRGLVAISPDNTRAAVLTALDEGTFLRIYDLETAASLRIDVGEIAGLPPYNAIYWAEDGMIYLSASEETLLDPYGTDEEYQAVTDAFSGLWTSTRNSSIYRIAPNSGLITELHLASATWSIMRFESYEGYLYWAEIPDGSQLAADFINGIISADYEGQIPYDYLQPDVYRMPLDGGDVELVAEDLSQFIILRDS